MPKKKKKQSKFCELECSSNARFKERFPGKDIDKEFLGPVKIVLVDPDPKVYRWNIKEGACVSVTQLMIGATIMMVFLFAISLQMPMCVNVHIILCSSGYQLLMPMSILVADGRETSSIPQKRKDKQKEHFCMAGIASFFCIIGTFIGEFLDTKYSRGWTMQCNDTTGLSHRSLDDDDLQNFVFGRGRSAHSIMAWITLVITLAAVITGPLTMFLDLEETLGKMYKAFHAIFGLLCFLSSSTCFILGLAEGNFGVWLRCARIPEGLYILIFFCTMYTLTIVLIGFLKMFKGYQSPD